ncbi:MAG: prepilin-type N-terminal cleavage/methylation domain-containing protein [Candidatus Omnitrophota bacterium]
MDRKGVTLVEFIVVVVISGFIVVAIACQFVAELTFRQLISDQVFVTSESAIAMRHMVRVLRYADPSKTVTTGANKVEVTIDHKAAGDNLPEITANTAVAYRLNGALLEYRCGSGGSYRKIADNISAFSSSWDSDSILTLALTAKKKTRSCPLETKVRFLGGA